MANVQRNPDHQPVTVDSVLDDEIVGARISELLDRALELECRQDRWSLDEEEVVELADIRLRIADYAIAQTVDQFDLNIT